MGQTQIEGHATKYIISNPQNCQKKKKKKKSEKLSCLGRAQGTGWLNMVTKYPGWNLGTKKRKLGEGWETNKMGLKNED